MSEFQIYMTVMVALIGLLAFAVFRGRKIIAANDSIVQGQIKQIEQADQSIKVQDRQAAALERIAIALEKT